MYHMRYFEDFWNFLFCTGGPKKGGPVGGSNDPQSSPNFFSELFMIFVHRKKKAIKILKKVQYMVHPNMYICILYMYIYNYIHISSVDFLSECDTQSWANILFIISYMFISYKPKVLISLQYAFGILEKHFLSLILISWICLSSIAQDLDFRWVGVNGYGWLSDKPPSSCVIT